MSQHEKQEVTGIVVNDVLHAPRGLRRHIRQVAHYIDKFSLDGHLDRIGNRRPHYTQHILGLANHVLFVGKQDRDAERLFALLPEPKEQMETLDDQE